MMGLLGSGYFYIAKQKQVEKLGATQNYLELTEQLLGE